MRIAEELDLHLERERERQKHMYVLMRDTYAFIHVCLHTYYTYPS